MPGTPGCPGRFSEILIFLRVSYFRNPYGAPRPTESQNPAAIKKKLKQNRKPRLSPKVNVLSPKVNVMSPKVNVLSPNVNVNYFQGIFEEFKVFEISCWGVMVTGVSKISNLRVFSARFFPGPFGR